MHIGCKKLGSLRRGEETGLTPLGGERYIWMAQVGLDSPVYCANYLAKEDFFTPCKTDASSLPCNHKLFKWIPQHQLFQQKLSVIRPRKNPDGVFLYSWSGHARVDHTQHDLLQQLREEQAFTTTAVKAVELCLAWRWLGLSLGSEMLANSQITTWKRNLCSPLWLL